MTPSAPRATGASAALVAAVLAACAPSAPVATPVPLTAADSAARAAVARERLQQLAPKTPPNAIAVTPFVAPRGDTLLEPLAYGLADLVTTDLARLRGLRVLERTRLDALLRELEFAQSGRVDAATAPQAGRLMNASRLVVGAVGLPTAERLRLDVRVAEVESGQVRDAVSASAPLDDILEAEKELVFRLADQLGVTPTPAERAAIERKPTRSLAALLAYGRGRRAELGGDLEGARRHYREARQLDVGFEQPQLRLNTLDLSLTPPPPITVPAFVNLGSAGERLVNNINKPLDQIPQVTSNTAAATPQPAAAVVEVIITIQRP